MLKIGPKLWFILQWEATTTSSHPLQMEHWSCAAPAASDIETKVCYCQVPSCAVFRKGNDSVGFKIELLPKAEFLCNAKIIWELSLRTKSQVLPMLGLPVPRRKRPPLPSVGKVTGMKRGGSAKGEGDKGSKVLSLRVSRPLFLLILKNEWKMATLSFVKLQNSALQQQRLRSTSSYTYIFWKLMSPTILWPPTHSS